MKPQDRSDGAARTPIAFNGERFLEFTGLDSKPVKFVRGETIFTQGDLCDSVLYIETGAVKLSVLSIAGKEAVVGMLGPGDFFGEHCLIGQPRRTGSATAVSPSTVLVLGKEAMIQLLHRQRAMSDRFISHLLARNIRSGEDLVDQLFNSTEKRLARTLLLLARARNGTRDNSVMVVPKISQATLAEMIGTTRSRVNVFLKKFKKAGFIEGTGEFRVHSSLLTVVLHE